MNNLRLYGCVKWERLEVGPEPFILAQFNGSKKSRLLWIPSDHLSIVLAISLYLLTQSLHSRNTALVVKGD
ncbi:hypothetical protein OUZ56_018923 [Daphnia magna]|uniref:Uncharacterized protein n=1 Tax=Daphnia magna TaxID=35525 RepID=A0ABQ9ZB85_9CRUS|nr:hypothetical protein OUZ56_018923 [Daphnia magna]